MLQLRAAKRELRGARCAAHVARNTWRAKLLEQNAQALEERPYLLSQHMVRESIQRRCRQIYDCQAGSVLFSQCRNSGRRLDDQGRPGHYHEIALAAERVGPLQFCLAQILAKGNSVGFEQPTAFATPGSRSCLIRVR